jgi:hypothetical protein
MNYFYSSLCILSFCLTPLLGDNNPLLQKLEHAVEGDYLVTYRSKAYTLIHIAARQENVLHVEEISVPAAKFDRAGLSWPEWVSEEGPGHTSWIMYALDFSGGEIHRCYSFTKKKWMSIPKSENFISALLALPFDESPLSSRKKLGPPPLPGDQDLRSVWHPKLVFEGLERQGEHFSAWQAIWPHDGTPLAGKRVTVYLPESDRYPGYLPYWIEIQEGIKQAHLRVVDSGRALYSPKPLITTTS